MLLFYVVGIGPSCHRLALPHSVLGGAGCGARGTSIALHARHGTMLLGVVDPA